MSAAMRASRGGNVPLGGGTSVQKKYGIEDSPDLVFKDLTDWSIVQPNGVPDYRYNDREIIRAFADNSAPTFEWLLAHGVVFVDKPPDRRGGISVGNSVLRTMHAAPIDWPLIQTGKPATPAQRLTMSTGNGLMQPLDAAARKAGVQYLLEHKMTALHRENGDLGPRRRHRSATTRARRVNIRARKAVIIATGGSTGNVNFRRMFDPRLTEEYCGLAGMPYSDQDASGEIAGMAGRRLAVGPDQLSRSRHGSALTKPGQIGTQYGYVNLRWLPGSPVFDKARATGLARHRLAERDHGEHARQALLRRDRPAVHRQQLQGRRSLHPRPAISTPRTSATSPNNWLNAAMAGIGDGHNGGGPIWAIFDQGAVEREKWDPNPPNVDIENGFFFKADTIAELAKKIVMKYQRVPMPPGNLEATVGALQHLRRYRPRLRLRQAAAAVHDQPSRRSMPPGATPVLHDTRAGLRINARCQVVDMNGEVIPGLYCGGESAGGFSLHGLARCLQQGVIAGRNAHAEAVPV